MAASPVAQPGEQLIPRYRLKLVARPEITRHDARDLGAVALADAAQGEQQADDGILAGKPVEDPLAVAAPCDERRAAKNCRWRDELASVRPVRAAKSSTLRSPCPRCSSISRRWACPSA